MGVYRLRNGKELEAKVFVIGAGRNNPESMYYGIETDIFVERLLEWGPLGKCIYASKYIVDHEWRSWLWNNQGPMEIDKFVKLEEYDIIYPLWTVKHKDSSELKAKAKFINPILSLELE